MYNYSDILKEEFQKNAKLINEEVKPFSYKSKEPVRALIQWIADDIELDYRFDKTNILTFVYDILTPSTMQNLIDGTSNILASYSLHVEIDKNDCETNEVIKSFKKESYQWCTIEPVENISDKDKFLPGIAGIISRTDDTFLETYGIKSLTDVAIKITTPTVQEQELQKQFLEYMNDLHKELFDNITPVL